MPISDDRKCGERREAGLAHQACRSWVDRVRRSCVHNTEHLFLCTTIQTHATRLYTRLSSNASALTRFRRRAMENRLQQAMRHANSLKKNFLMLSKVLMMRFGAGVVVVGRGFTVTGEVAFSPSFSLLALARLNNNTAQTNFSFIAFDSFHSNLLWNFYFYGFLTLFCKGNLSTQQQQRDSRSSTCSEREFLIAG